MKNNDVIISFLNHYPNNTQHLYSDGQKLINYSTVIAYHKDGNLYINKRKYSVTTSKIQTNLVRLATQFFQNGQIIFYE